MTPKESALPVSIALVGALLGFFLASSKQCPHPHGASDSVALTPAAGGTDLAPLLDELRALGDRIVSLQAGAVMPRVPSVTTDRVSVAASSDAATNEPAEAIVLLLDRCTALVERLERKVNSGPQLDLSQPPPTASAQSLKQYDDSPGHGEKEFTGDHLMWSYQQVLERYGKPSEFYRNSGGVIRWAYETDEGVDGRTRSFIFVDGFVSRCDM